MLEQIEAWRKELVNLNRTNRLLYFRHSKTSSVTLRGRTPDELLSRMDSPSKPGWGFETTATETLAGDHLRTDKDDPRLQPETQVLIGETRDRVSDHLNDRTIMIMPLSTSVTARARCSRSAGQLALDEVGSATGGPGVRPHPVPDGPGAGDDLGV